MELYWGDLHNHCGISYGFGGLENALRAARTHLDFCCVTGHAMWPDMIERNSETAFIIDFHEHGFAKLRANWPQTQAMINAYNTEELVTFQSYEMHSSKYGDYHIVSPDSDLPLIDRESPGELVRDCGRRAIAVPHHIGYTPGYRGINWELFDERISPIVEVCSKHGCAMREDGPFPYYHDMGPLDPRHTVAEGLKRGLRFSFAGSTDHHAGFPGSYGDGVVGVWAESKTREAIWEALCKGRTYATTGERIRCGFWLNGAMMGESVKASKRHLRFVVQGDAPLELLTIRRNGRVVASLVPKAAPAAQDSAERYLLRVEMGWGSSPDRYHWEGELAVEGGAVRRIQPYLRGLNALSPHDGEADNQDRTNDLDNGYIFEENSAHFRCDTVCNKSTLHPQTSAFVFEIQAALSAEITLKINGKQEKRRLGELLEAGFSLHMKPWASHAVKMHTAYAVDACAAEMEIDDDAPEKEWDVYQAEAVEVNGSRAFVSPIFVGRG